MKNPVATVVSYILHPLLVPTYIIIFLLNMDVFLAFMIPFTLRLWIISMFFMVTFAMPAMMIWMMHRRGIIYLNADGNAFRTILSIIIDNNFLGYRVCFIE